MEYVSPFRVDLWSRIDPNSRFMKDLRKKCTSEPGNAQFWSLVQQAGRKIGLISDVEAEEHGGTSSVSESKAEKVGSILIDILCISFILMIHQFLA